MKNSPIIQNLQGQQAVEVNAVLKNTYLMLSLSLLVSAGAAWYAMVTNAAPMGILMLLVGMFGLQFLTISLKDSPWGILSTFAFTAFMGYSLGPILNFYIASLSNGGEIIMTSLGATGLIFLGLSMHAVTSRKNYSYLGGFIFMGFITAFIIGMLAMFFQLPMLSLLISGAFAVLSSAYILHTTSAIIHGGERNYIMATITLYVSLFNLFVSLLRILAYFAGNRD